MGPELAKRSTRRCWARRAIAAVTGLVVVAVASGCTSEEIRAAKALGLPPPASREADEMGALWVGSWIAALAVGVFMWGLILWAAFRYRRRDPDEVPIQTRYNVPIEVLYTVVPFIIISVLFFFTLETQNNVFHDDPNPDHEVLVVGQKWSWAFSYLDEPSLDGQTDVYDIGTPEDPPTLWLPVNESMRFELRSPDVIHSFWLPPFYFKLDVIPGRANTFTMTPDAVGTYQARCAEFCGTYHPRMLFTLRIVPRQEYDQHLADLQAAGQVGALTGELEPVADLDTGQAVPQEAQE